MGALALLPAASFAPDTDVLSIVLTIALLILSLGVHEWAHAWTAWKLGDPTAKDEGRLTLNPIAHIDLWWTVLLPGLLLLSGLPPFGGAKPVPVDMHRLRRPWRDMTLVALAGPFSNVVLAFGFLGLWVFFVRSGFYNDAAQSLSGRSQDLLPQVLLLAAKTNVVLAVFNMLPIPPLDGSRLMEHALPSSIRASYLAIGGFGLLIVYMALQYIPAFNSAYRGTVTTIFNTLTSWAISVGGLR